MKKKFFLIIFVFIGIILITGCGSKNNERVEIMENLVGTWEFEKNTDNNTKITGIRATYSFDYNYRFTYKLVMLVSGNKEATMYDLTGTYELNMDDKKIMLTFDDTEKSDEMVKEIAYKYENGKFTFHPDKDGNLIYFKK